MTISHRLFSFVALAFLLITHAVKPQRAHGMVGGYAPADVNDPFVKSVAQFAVEELEKNKSQCSFLASVPADTHLKGTVIQAGMQVVAGRNYKLVMTISDSSSCLGALEVTIYDHFGDLSLTNFGKEMTCAEADALVEESESDSEEGL